MINYNKTWVSIANEALARLGNSQIDSLEDSDTTSVFCKKLLPSAVSTIFSSHDWNCAKKRVSLPMLSDRPSFGYSYKFELPNDFSKAVSVSTQDYQIEEGNKLLSNDSYINLIYISLPEDATKINPPILRSALVLYLAYELSTSITGNAQITKQIYDEFSIMLNQAKIQNDTRNKEEVLGGTPLWCDQR